MSLFKNKKRRLSLAGFVLISFSIMAAFSIFLHDHQFDPFTPDDDCAPCHWTQINVDVDPDISSVDFIPATFSKNLEVRAFHYNSFKYSYFGLSPPTFS